MLFDESGCHESDISSCPILRFVYVHKSFIERRDPLNLTDVVYDEHQIPKPYIQSVCADNFQEVDFKAALDSTKLLSIDPRGDSTKLQ